MPRRGARSRTFHGVSTATSSAWRIRTRTGCGCPDGLESAGLTAGPCASAARTLRSHGAAQELIDASLIAAAFGLEPGENIGVETNSHRLLYRAIKFADNGPAPIRNLPDVRGVNLRVRQCGQRGKLILQFLAPGSHRLSFPAAWLCGPK